MSRGVLVEQREKEALVFSKGGAAVLVSKGGSCRRKGFRFTVFSFLPSFIFFNSSPVSPFFHCSMIFIGEVLLGFQTSPSTFPFLSFSFFFCKF